MWGAAPGGGTTTCSQALGIPPHRRPLCCSGRGEHFEGLELLWSFTELTSWQQAVRGAPCKSKAMNSVHGASPLRGHSLSATPGLVQNSSGFINLTARSCGHFSTNPANVSSVIQSLGSGT